MNLLDEPRFMRSLQAGTYIVVVACGFRAASEILVVLFAALTGAYAFLPLANWFMKRFESNKRKAMAIVGLSGGTSSLAMVFVLHWRFVVLMEKLPAYREHFASFYESLAVSLHGLGINIPALSSAQSPDSDRTVEMARMLIPQAGSLFATSILIVVLAFIFLLMMMEHAGTKRSAFVEALAYYGEDTKRYVAAMAVTGGISALAILLLLLALRVDFPLLWAVLYFFLQFIPSIGFIISIVPPTFLALIMFGWERALLVIGGLVVINTLNDYVLTPMFMKKGVDVSFLTILLSLMIWGFLLGPAGGILAVPLTLALKKYIEGFSKQKELSVATPG
jgi:AI-2 transport protein TqsA